MSPVRRTAVVIALAIALCSVAGIIVVRTTSNGVLPAGSSGATGASSNHAVDERAEQSGAVDRQVADQDLAFDNQAQSFEDDLYLHFENGQLTIQARDLPVDVLLAEVGRVAGITFVGAEEFGNESISIEMTDVPVETALREILREWDSFLYYGTNGGVASKLQAVWVYPTGRGRGLAPVSTEEWENLDVLAGKLTDRAPYVRLRALEVLALRGDEASRRVVLDAMTSELDDAIRMQMLTTVAGTSVEVPQSVWTTLVSNDPSEDVRVFALLQLEDDPGIRDIASAALIDPSPGVRGLAEMLLEDLDELESAVPTAPPLVRQQ